MYIFPCPRSLQLQYSVSVLVWLIYWTFLKVSLPCCVYLMYKENHFYSLGGKDGAKKDSISLLPDFQLFWNIVILGFFNHFIRSLHNINYVPIGTRIFCNYLDIFNRFWNTNYLIFEFFSARPKTLFFISAEELLVLNKFVLFPFLFLRKLRPFGAAFINQIKINKI